MELHKVIENSELTLEQRFTLAKLPSQLESLNPDELRSAYLDLFKHALLLDNLKNELLKQQLI